MLNQKMLEIGREKFEAARLNEYGLLRSKEIGEENVLNFAIGNPKIPSPKEVKEALLDIIENENPTEVHGYSMTAGRLGTRNAIANHLNKEHNTSYDASNLFLTCGSSPGLSIMMIVLVTKESDEIMLVAPYYCEYPMFIKAAGGKMVVVDPLENYDISIENIRKKINKNTKAIIINSPNNPGGFIYTREKLQELSKLLREKSQEFGHEIYIVSDEPYRELVMVEDTEVPRIPNLYENTVVLYSYSKSLSLPGERLGYILTPDSISNKEELDDAIHGAARAVGHFCAPTMIQMLVERCADVKPDLSIYKENRDLLYKELTRIGFEVTNPQGAFYLFIQAPDGDGKKLSQLAKKYDLLLVPGDSFGIDSAVRMSYCVETEKVKKSLPLFEKIMEEYKSTKLIKKSSENLKASF